MKKIWILSSLAEYFDAFQNYGVVSRAFKKDYSFEVINIRNFGIGNYNQIDDTPYGGGAGMVLRADVLEKALLDGTGKKKSELLVFSPGPRGEKMRHESFVHFSQIFQETDKDLVFVCGRYEGIDQRFIDQYIDYEFSIGDYVLSGGELAVQVFLDGVLRLIPGVLGNEESLSVESFTNEKLEHSLYTKPQEFNGVRVPKVLLSGHHQKIEEYREAQSLEITKKLRPDLL